MTTKTGMSKEWTVDGEDGRVDAREVEGQQVGEGIGEKKVKKNKLEQSFSAAVQVVQIHFLEPKCPSALEVTA